MQRQIILILLLICSSVTLYSQCAEEQTFFVCDMLSIDSDANGTPDGIINLYEELSTITGTSITVADGTWFDPGFNFALNDSTGDLFLFDLTNSSESNTDYQFELLNSSSGCPGDVRYLFNIVLGPFSGIPAGAAGSSSDLQLCQPGNPPSECEPALVVDLFLAMIGNPSPHRNGTWVYLGSSSSFLEVNGSNASFNVPYQPGPPLVDEEFFDFEYRVPGITPCSLEEVTPVTISVTKEPFAGFANQFSICETELLAGDFDADIDLTDDGFLVNENIEGIWLQNEDPTGQISGPGDSVINLREIYDDLVAADPQFGCMTYEFTYFVESRSPICGDARSTVSFTFYEFIRPFSQDETIELCVDDETNTTLNLYDSLVFTQEGPTLFEYPLNTCTNWTLISGPSSLGLVSNTGNICSTFEDPGYTSQGTIDVSLLVDNSTAGTYVFEFTVDESYHCSSFGTLINVLPDGCDFIIDAGHPCSPQTATVTLIVHPVNYAGEDTADLDICESDDMLILTNLLNTNDVETVYVGPDGIWTDLDSGLTIGNDFVIPEITDNQIFNFEYNTITENDCDDSAMLTFTVHEQYDPGTDEALSICAIADEIDLFGILGGSPNDIGTWEGPNGYSSSTNTAIFDPAVNEEGSYVYTVPENVNCPSAQATITVSLSPLDYAGEDTGDVEVCEIINEIDLFTLLTTNGTDIITLGGQWTDSIGTIITNPFIFPSNISESQSFNFIYTTAGTTGCPDEATLSFTVFEQFNSGTGTTLEICANATSFNLFDELTNMPNTNGTWSGPGGYTTTDHLGVYDPLVNIEGSYTYIIPANGVCEASTAIVSISFLDRDYAGEDTLGVELCETEGTVDLTTLLETNGVDSVSLGGEWTNKSGAVISNIFNIPIVNNQETFDFVYSTTTANGCNDQARLNFTVFERNLAGVGTTLSFCVNEGSVNLFDALGSTADTNGTWVGPNGFTASSANAEIDLATATSGDYVYTIAQNGACFADTETINLVIFPLSNAGDDVDTFVCPGNYTLNLSGLLDNDATPNGDFINLSTGEEVPLGMLEVASLDDGVFSFLYVVSSGLCPEDDATITFTVETPPLPVVLNVGVSFCIDEEITLGDLIVEGVDDFDWYAFPEGGNQLPFSTFLVNGETYFVAGIDDNGCESVRVPYTAEILPLDNGNCQIDITNGVSDNNDGVNDELDLGVLPILFPDFDIQIFNRYGTTVYEGNTNTSLFNGKSNRGSNKGDQLPTGVYFYVFYPNDGNSSPISGNFYLSR